MPLLEENLFQCMSRMINSDIDPSDQQAEIWDRYGEKVAVLILDSAGFSRVTESHGIVYFLSRLMLLRNLVEPLLDAHNCKHLNFRADNAFAFFDEVDDAIACAKELHNKVFESGLMLTESERFRVSIGIGYGDMLYSETLEGYFSEEMNFASKLGEDLARSNETRITVNAYNHAQPYLVEGFTLQRAEMSGLALKHYRQVFTPDSTAV